MTLVRHAFTAMGTSCELAVAASPEDEPQAQRALAAGLVEVETCERALTRFSPSSDLSRLNGALGEWVEVDPRLVAALRAAVDARRVTARPASTRRSSSRSSPPATTGPSPS